ncbi:MAG: sigma-70 family RNA polymerase sigma factor [Woeseia sp.]
MPSTASSTRQRRFDELVSVWHSDMYRYALWLCRDPLLAEDVVQDALIRAWKSLDALREATAAKQWLLTIVRRENARHFARKKLQTVDIDTLTPAQAALLGDEQDTERDDIRAAIFELPDDYREPLVLQVLMGYTTDEIAETMNITAGAVLTRLHRARHKLKARLSRPSAR